MRFYPTSDEREPDVTGHAVPDGLPREAVHIFVELLGMPRDSVEELVERARAHGEMLMQAHQNGKGVAPEDIERALRGCEELLEMALRSKEPRALSDSVAATRYFIATDDAESDLAVGGLDDDLAVIEAVSRYVRGRAEECNMAASG